MFIDYGERSVLLKPFRQGGLDLFCGVYSTVNAVKMLLGNQITDDDEFLEIAVNCISKLVKERGLSFLSEGLNSRDITFLLRKVALTEYGIKSRKAFKFSNISLGEYWNTVREFLGERKSAGVIICIDPVNWGHWTVITKATARRLVLLDSIGIKFLHRRHCTTRKLTSRRDMLLSPTRTYFLYK